jgi:hypothetical protein
MRERHERCAIDLRTRCCASVQAGDALLELGDALERSIPSRLQFARNQPLGGINYLVATRSQRGFIASLLELSAQRKPKEMLNKSLIALS